MSILPNRQQESLSPSQKEIEVVVVDVNNDHSRILLQQIPAANSRDDNMFIVIKAFVLPVLAKIHAGYFRISLSLCSQALLWKILMEPTDDSFPAFRRKLQIMLPSTGFILLWSLSLVTLASLSLLYILHWILYNDLVKNEFLHHVGVNYLFAPWISWLLLLQSTPAPWLLFFNKPTSTINYSCYPVLYWIFILPILILDIKIYGQWFTKGKKRVLSGMANPTSQLSVIGNLVAARAAAEMGWFETAICMFSLGMIHYLVLFVTLYQRLPGSNSLPSMLRPVFFLFFAAPSMASLARDSISGNFDCSSKMLFFLSLFLFISLICRPALFKKSMKKFNLAWWAYSFPITAMAIASTKYAQEVKTGSAHLLMLLLSAISVLVSSALMVFTALHTNSIVLHKDQELDHHLPQQQ
ncbi:hypothetical protein M9H77_11793 [Catharanthus roseus]|uniref:Uncharacterized protein n=1 Tax=Catharanthus roseus TaxID=4058 RepID=A0ACC0BFK8_CATRO|nr:hypothetical protein M9H77_11793 [Catharanthus roseus]